jgi:nucleoside 2-deoxyribosyltransferase
MRIYLAAPLFTEAERAFNLVLARSLKADGHDVYRPQRDTAPAAGPGRTTAMFTQTSRR